MMANESEVSFVKPPRSRSRPGGTAYNLGSFPLGAA